MFEQSLLETSQTPTRRPLALALSLLLQTALIAVLVLVPLYMAPAISRDELLTFLDTSPPPPPPPPPPPAAAPAPKPQPRQQAQARQTTPERPPVRYSEIDQGKLITPKSIPSQVATIEESAAPPPPAGGLSGVPGGVAGGIPGGEAGGILGGVLSKNVAPPPQKPPERIRVGGNVQQAKLINEVMPTYPQAARQANIEGTARLEAVVSKDGRIKELRVAQGHPLLNQAALSAVRQWRYQPTILNGKPVEVSTVIDVHFKLQ